MCEPSLLAVVGGRSEKTRSVEQQTARAEATAAGLTLKKKLCNNIKLDPSSRPCLLGESRQTAAGLTLKKLVNIMKLDPSSSRAFLVDARQRRD